MSKLYLKFSDGDCVGIGSVEDSGAYPVVTGNDNTRIVPIDHVNFRGRRYTDVAGIPAQVIGEIRKNIRLNGAAIPVSRSPELETPCCHTLRARSAGADNADLSPVLAARDAMAATKAVPAPASAPAMGGLNLNPGPSAVMPPEPTEGK